MQRVPACVGQAWGLTDVHVRSRQQFVGLDELPNVWQQLRVPHVGTECLGNRVCQFILIAVHLFVIVAMVAASRAACT